jgi:hypothetical protein
MNTPVMALGLIRFLDGNWIPPLWSKTNPANLRVRIPPQTNKPVSVPTRATANPELTTTIEISMALRPEPKPPRIVSIPSVTPRANPARVNDTMRPREEGTSTESGC